MYFLTLCSLKPTPVVAMLYNGTVVQCIYIDPVFQKHCSPSSVSVLLSVRLNLAVVVQTDNVTAANLMDNRT